MEADSTSDKIREDSSWTAGEGGLESTQDTHESGYGCEAGTLQDAQSEKPSCSQNCDEPAALGSTESSSTGDKITENSSGTVGEGGLELSQDNHTTGHGCEAGTLQDALSEVPSCSENCDEATASSSIEPNVIRESNTSTASSSTSNKIPGNSSATAGEGGLESSQNNYASGHGCEAGTLQDAQNKEHSCSKSHVEPSTSDSIEPKVIRESNTSTESSSSSDKENSSGTVGKEGLESGPDSHASGHSCEAGTLQKAPSEEPSCSESRVEPSASDSIGPGLIGEPNTSSKSSSHLEVHFSSPSEQAVKETDNASFQMQGASVKDREVTTGKAVEKDSIPESSSFLLNDNIKCLPVTAASTDVSTSDEPAIRRVASSDSSTYPLNNVKPSVTTASNESVCRPIGAPLCTESPNNKVSTCSTETRLKPVGKDEGGQSTETEKQFEEEDLYSELISASTKVKILKKYFGDSRRPGICHRPHHKRNYGSFKCKECYLSFNYLPSLLFHKNTHGKKRHVYECCKCGYKSSIPGAYSQHELTRHPDQLYQCRDCSLTFLQESTFNRHMAGSHPDQLTGCQQQQQQPSRFVCNLCCAVLPSKPTMTAHLKLQHSITIPIDSINPNVAGRHQQIHASAKQGYYHVIPESKPTSGKQHRDLYQVKCKHCKQVFDRRGTDFVQHRQAVEKSVAWAKTICQWCSYVGASPCKLAHHKRKVHFCCWICNRKHASKELLKQHKKCFHHGFMKKEGVDKETGLPRQGQDQPPALYMQPQHQCPKCKISCASDKDLWNHMIQFHGQNETQPVAMGTDPVHHWYCMTCKVIFPTKRLLDLHIKLNHRRMRRIESSPEQPDDDREWRCLLCNTLHENRQACDKHQSLHHPDEYEYCSQAEIAEPTLPLVMSALSETGPPYTCNMCDCKITSVEELHKHKEQFHKVAYSISISEELHAKKRSYKCRYRCGYTDSTYKNVVKHEPTCKMKTAAKPSILSQPPIVLDPSSGELVSQSTAVSEPDVPSQQSLEKDAVSSSSKVLPGPIEEQKTTVVNKTINVITTIDRNQGASPTVVEKQVEVIKPVSNIQQLPQPQPQQTIHSGPSAPMQPSSTVSKVTVGKVIQSSRVVQAQQSKLPVYGKHDPISSSSDESDCSWLDKSSDSDSGGSETPMVDVESLSSDEGDSQEDLENTPEGPEESSLTSAHQNQGTGLGGQGMQGKPSSSNTCPPLLQPTVLMRFFQAIDMSDLYRLALQMITGSPQPHSLPMSDLAMGSSKTARFKYKIPLGYSHKEFQETPLFPSSRDVMRVDFMQTLPVPFISKHYKGVLAKPFLPYLSNLVDSAILNHFEDNVVKGIERFVRKQRVDDRRDITLRLSQYIVSQYFKNQQKSPSNQPSSSLGAKVSVTKPASSPGAGPSGTQKQPPTIRLLISPAAFRPSATPITTVKYVGASAAVPNARAAQIQTNAQVSYKLPLTGKPINVTPPKVGSGSNAVASTSSAASTSEADQMKSADAESSPKQPQTSNRDSEKVEHGSQNKKSPVASTANERKPEVKYSVPVRRSARLLRSSDQQQSLPVSAEETNGISGSLFSDIEITKGKRASLRDQKSTKMQSKTTKSQTSKTANGDGTNCGGSDDSKCDEANHKIHDQNLSKDQIKATHTDKCKDSLLYKLVNNSDHDAPKSKPESSETTPTQTWSTSRTTVSETKSSKSSHSQQVCNSEMLDGKHNLMLHPVQGELPEVRVDAKQQRNSILSDTIERDGVIETRMPRRPLYGLNGSTMQRLNSSDSGAYHIIRQACPLSGSSHFRQTVSVNLQKFAIPQGPISLAGMPLKACDLDLEAKQQNLVSRGSGPEAIPILQPDDVKRKEQMLPECNTVITERLTQPFVCSHQPRKELPLKFNPAPTPTQNYSQDICIGQTWKKTVTKDEVLAIMAKRKIWRCAPYKTVPDEDVKGEGSLVEKVDELQTCGVDGEHSQTCTQSLDSVATTDNILSYKANRHDSGPFSHSAKSNDGEEIDISSNVINEVDPVTNVNNSINLSGNGKSGVKRQALTDASSCPEKKPCIRIHDHSRTEEIMDNQEEAGRVSDLHGNDGQETLAESESISTPGQRNAQCPVVTGTEQETQGTAQEAVRSSEEQLPQIGDREDAKKAPTCSTSQSREGGSSDSHINTAGTQDETNITRRSLRRMDLKRKNDFTTENKTKKQKPTVDHSYIKTSGSETRIKSKKPRVSDRVIQKGSRKLRVGKNESAGDKTNKDTLMIPHDHSYTGKKEHGCSPQGKSRLKMDHSYYWKTPELEHETIQSWNAIAPSQGSKGLPSQQIRRGSVDNRSRDHDHSYFSAIPKQVQEQIAAMDHCYVKLTPINLEGVAKKSPIERESTRAHPTTNVRCQGKFDQSSAVDEPGGASLRRELRPRRKDFS